MATIEQVTRYRADDGETFDTLQQAEAHEAKARLKDLLYRRSAYGDISVEDAVDELIENAGDFLALLRKLQDGND